SYAQAVASSPVVDERPKDPDFLHAQGFMDFLKETQSRQETKISFVALGKDWIDTCVKGYPQAHELNELIIALRRFCREKNIEFFDGSDTAVMGKIIGLKEKDAHARGIVLTGQASAAAFEQILGEKGMNDKTITIAGVDTKNLTADSFIRLVEMLEILMELSATPWLEPEALIADIRARHPELPFEARPAVNGKPDIMRITFLPKAEPVTDYEHILKARYLVQIAA
ncbi:MAG: hypothetical protein PHS37_03885, partial [Candidatus Omnitrophica bacterium]|nr:hypothetical protein [Candidatus Omnitrophota bacterium]